MTEVEIANGYLRVVVEGFDKVLALKSSVEVPLTHVRGASQDPDALHERHGLRLGGTSLPGVVAAGTFFDGRWWFLDVHHRSGDLDLGRADLLKRCTNAPLLCAPAP
jgi:hypothetical protein